MSSGETGGKDLTVETLEFIHTNWQAVALLYPTAVTSGVQYDTRQYDSGTDVWDAPILRNEDDKTLYPSGEQATGDTKYNNAKRKGDVVTVEDAGGISEPTGTEFDYDVEYDLDVTVSALDAGSYTNVDDSTDFQVFVDIVVDCILLERQHPITDPNCKYDWRWILTTDTSKTPEATGRRVLQEVEFTTRWFGYRSNVTI